MKAALLDLGDYARICRKQILENCILVLQLAAFILENKKIGLKKSNIEHRRIVVKTRRKAYAWQLRSLRLFSPFPLFYFHIFTIYFSLKRSDC